MARIAGLKKHRSPSGKVTHVTLSVKHFGHLLEDILDGIEIDKAKKKADLIEWDKAKKRLDKKFGFSTKK